MAEELIREALHPYKGIFVATKAGLARTGPDQWTPLGRAEYLIQQAYTSCSKLGVERIDLWQLHRIDPKVPRDEQFGAVKQLLDSGVIRYAGLSEVSVADIEAASKVFEVATVQNRYNLVDRGSEDVLDYCTRAQDRVHPLVPPGRRRSGRSRLGARHDCQEVPGSAQPGGARLDAQTQPGDAAHSGHLEGGAPRGECRGGGDRAVG